jgi:hypothetical protein
MSGSDIEIAVLQRAAMRDLRLPEDLMTSPYLNQVRSTRNIIDELIVAREVELAKTSAAVQRQRIEADLTLLRDELARLDGEAEPGAGLCDTATQDERIRDECSR